MQKSPNVEIARKERLNANCISFVNFGCTSMLNMIAAMTPWIMYKVVVRIQKVFAFLPSQTDTR